MYITEGVNQKYCYVCETVWDKTLHKYRTPSKCIGYLDSEQSLVPNRYLSQLLSLDSVDPSSLTDYELLVLKTVLTKYGDYVKDRALNKPLKSPSEKSIMTAEAVFMGPKLVFGEITKRYHLDSILKKAFGENVANDILSLSWYLASEGNALSNSDSWLEYYENPRGSSMSSQDVSRLLDAIDYDGMMTFYKLWLEEASKKAQTPDKVLYDLTSISYYGCSLDCAEYGYNRSRKALPQVNYALLCMRSTAMPLFAWPLNGSITDISTLETTLQFLKKLQFTPDCLMMDRGFCSMDNISGMFKNKYTFLQAVKVNAKWIYGVIDASEHMRFDPNSKMVIGGRTYYASTSICKWVRVKTHSKNGSSQEEIRVHICEGSAREKYVPDDESIEVIAQYSCRVHVLFCQDLVGKQHDTFMDKLKAEYDRLIHDEEATVKKEFEQFIKVYKKKYSRHRTVAFDTAMIAQHKNKYAGHICFLTNDKTIETAVDALTEYSTRDFIEKDFDEMKNELDMQRIRVHCDNRMKARLFLQFIAEIYMREIRVCLQNAENCKKLTTKQIFSHIRTINKVKFEGKYRDVYSPLSKKQRDILEALKVSERGLIHI